MDRPSLEHSTVAAGDSFPRLHAPAPLTDNALVDKARSGDLSAFEELVKRHQARIYRLTAHILRSHGDADDLTQETFVRAYRALGRFDGRSEFFTWLYRIAVNLCLNALRSRKSRARNTTLEDARIDGIEPNADSGRPDEDALRKQTYALLCEGIDSLSETLRTTMILVCVDGVSHEEAAAILGAPAGTIAWRVHEARRKLREFMVERGVDPEGGAR